MKKIKFNKRIWIIAGLIAVSITGIYLFNQVTPNSEQGVHIIEFDGEGFHPEELSISLGETVTFIGKVDRAFWPASNLHPSHTDYPEFDPREPIAPYESWSFKFNNAGTWKYHDHLAPYFTGVINVEDGQTKNIDACVENPNSTKCSKELILSVLEDKGLEPALELLAELYEEDSSIPSACHGITHDMGIAAYKNFLKDNDSVLTPKSAFCANGFYHGFMEAMLTASRDPQRAKEFCYYIDEKIGSEAPDASLQCHHGIGHGAMDIAILNASTIAKDERSLVAPALKLCEETSDTSAQLYRCTSGIFNGIANFYIIGEHGLSVNKDDPMWICGEQPEEYKESCYGNMNSVILWVSDNDFPIAIKYIENMEDYAYAVPSTRYLAGLATLSFAKGNHDQAIKACREIQENLHEACIEGFVHGFLEHGTPEYEYVDAFDFCKTQMMSHEERDICFRYVLRNIQGWYALDKAKQICRTAEADYKHHCSII